MKQTAEFTVAFFSVLIAMITLVASLIPYVEDENGTYWMIKSPNGREFFKTTPIKAFIESIKSAKKD